MRRVLTAALLTGTLLAAALPADAANNLVFDGNVLWRNEQTAGTPLPWAATSGPCATVAGGTMTTTQFGTVYMTHNRTNIDPMLVDPFNTTSPRWDPQLQSPVNCKYSGDAVVMTVPDPWFEQTNYVGAVAYHSVPATDWTQGWTYYNVTGAGRTDINYGKPLVILQGEYFTSMTLSNTNNYLLRGRVAFANGTTLTIPAGTYLFGEKATVGYLVIERGAQINAQGTKTQPIVLTSDQAPGAMAAGDNGGIVIHGRANANCKDFTAATPDSCESEGDTGHFFGGNIGAPGFNDADNSGILRYVRIEYSGKEVAPNNELNSLTMNAVGTGTTIDLIECFFGSDDSFEWFGGSARCKHLIAAGQDDDGLDWQLGFTGNVQYACVLQYPARGDKGIEADNSEFNFTAVPVSNPTFCNLTLVGTNPPTGGAGSTNIGVHWRRGTAGTILNSIILGFRGPGLNLSDNETFANCPGTPPAVYCQGAVSAVDIDQATINSGKLYMKASPNPTSGLTDIAFAVSRDHQHALAQIFDVNGRLVQTLHDGPIAKGPHHVRWDPKSLPTGSYYFRVTDEGGQAVNGKVVLVR